MAVNNRFAEIALKGHCWVERNGTEERDTEFLGAAFTSPVAEDFMPFAATVADEVAHVFHDSQDRYSDLPEHH